MYEPFGQSTLQKLYCHLPINEDKFAGTIWPILIYINSLSALIMGFIKLHPEAKHQPELYFEWISHYNLVAADRQTLNKTTR